MYLFSIYLLTNYDLESIGRRKACKKCKLLSFESLYHKAMRQENGNGQIIYIHPRIVPTISLNNIFFEINTDQKEEED